MHKPVFKGRIFHFVQFLEESGRIENPSSLDEGFRRLSDFIAYLGEQRYSPTTMKAYEFCCRHFVARLHQHRIPLAAIDEGILRGFATHECICPGTFVHKAERNRDYQFRTERLVRFFIMNGVPTSVASVDATGTDDLRDFRDWLRRHRGIAQSTVLDHARAVTRLRRQLGNDPARFDAALINRVMLCESQDGLAGGRAANVRLPANVSAVPRFERRVFAGTCRRHPEDTAMAAGDAAALHSRRRRRTCHRLL